MFGEKGMQERDMDFASNRQAAAPREPDIVDALAGLWRARYLLLVTSVIGGLLAIVYVARAPVLYTAQLTVTPSESSPSEATSRLSGLASLAGLQAGTHAGAPFDLFLLALRSHHVATIIAGDEPMLRALFPDRWSDARKRWIVARDRPSRFSLRRMLGLPTKRLGRPTPGEVDDMLDARIEVAQSSDKGTATIFFDDPQPAFAMRFVSVITKISDDFVKTRSLARSTEYIAYIQRRLRVASLAEDRQVLAAELGTRERSAMLASSGVPFAADPLGDPIASTQPTSPRLILSLAIGVLAGFAGGLLLLLLRQVGRRLRSPRD